MTFIIDRYKNEHYVNERVTKLKFLKIQDLK